MLEGHPLNDVTLEPLDDNIVVEPLDESELPSGLIVPVNEATQVRSGIVAAVGPDVGDRARRQGALPPRRRLRGSSRALVAPRSRAETRRPDRAHQRLTAARRYPVARSEGWQSGRMRRSRKPLSVVRRIEGSNPSPPLGEPNPRMDPHRIRPIGVVAGGRACERRPSSPVPPGTLANLGRCEPLAAEPPGAEVGDSAADQEEAEHHRAADRRVGPVESVRRLPNDCVASDGSTCSLPCPAARARGAPRCCRSAPSSPARRPESGG